MNTAPSKQKTWQSLSWDALAVHYHEIALKGGNRSAFTKQLAKNIARTLDGIEANVQPKGDRILISAAPDDIPEIAKRASRVFGVALVRPVKRVERDLAKMKIAGLTYYETMREGNSTFGVKTKRVDKTFGERSSEIDAAIGQVIVEKTGAPVNLNNPQVPLQFRVYKDTAYLLGPDLPGPGGLPIGATGRVLTLFSGGIDSSPAAWLIMRRGCKTDFLHFHIFPTAEPVKDTKIVPLLNTLLAPQGFKARLFLVPYHPFQLNIVTANLPAGLELILFRRFMLRVAERLCSQHSFSAIVTGDNLGQVASQTLESLAAVENVASRPVFQPLITYNKNDIISLSKEMGTYDESIKQYKDCCSLTSKRPITRPRIEDVARAEASLDLERMTEQAMKELEIWTVGD